MINTKGVLHLSGLHIRLFGATFGVAGFIVLAYSPSSQVLGTALIGIGTVIIASGGAS